MVYILFLCVHSGEKDKKECRIVLVRTIYLGLEIRTTRKRRKAEADEIALEWRIDPRKITPVLTFATRREIASTIGKCLYRYFTTGQPLALLPAALELIGILRRVAAKQTPNQVQWDARIVLEEESAEILKREWFLRQRNELITSCYRDIPVSQTCILATDASLIHYGYVILDINGALMHEFSAPFPLQMANLHIFLLELHWALEGQKAVIGPAKIYHLIDNNAVRHALTRGYSSNDLANRWMRGHLTSSPHVIEYVGVVSGENIADNPSRNLRVDINLCERTRDIVTHAIRGNKLGGSTPMDHRPEDEEPDDDGSLYKDLDDDDSPTEEAAPSRSPDQTARVGESS